MYTNISRKQSLFAHWQSYLPRLQERHYLLIIIALLTSICIGSLGSLSLAQHFLAQQKSSPTPPPSPLTAIYTDGACSANPKDMQYMPSVSTKKQATPLPSEWFNAGYTEQDFAYAQACGATFVIYYQSFNASNVKTLEAATYMLSAAAKKRFYEGDSQHAADPHMDASWRAQIEGKQIKQVAQVGIPLLGDVQYIDTNIVLTMTVPYQISMQTQRGTVVKSGKFRVQLASVAPTSQTQGASWQVTDWDDGVPSVNANGTSLTS